MDLQIAALWRVAIPISVNGFLNTIELFDAHTLHGRAHIVLNFILLLFLHLDVLFRTNCHLADQITAKLAKFLHIVRFTTTIDKFKKLMGTFVYLTFW